jgi:hypothetical protein
VGEAVGEREVGEVFLFGHGGGCGGGGGGGGGCGGGSCGCVWWGGLRARGCVAVWVVVFTLSGGSQVIWVVSAMRSRRRSRRVVQVREVVFVGRVVVVVVVRGGCDEEYDNR